MEKWQKPHQREMVRIWIALLHQEKPVHLSLIHISISFVFQNSRLLKGSILDNVRLGRAQATEAEVLAALNAAQCMDIVEKFPEGIHTVIGTKGVYLSGGEQQRIADVYKRQHQLYRPASEADLGVKHDAGARQ